MSISEMKLEGPLFPLPVLYWQFRTMYSCLCQLSPFPLLVKSWPYVRPCYPDPHSQTVPLRHWQNACHLMAATDLTVQA